ncbi:MAG: tyrosine-type recombinase/integrase [Myxococcales bacterium]|nr:tyrosine-type recombinase/integrase [Myxococcales bacterium]
MGDIVKKMQGGKFIGWYMRYRDVDGRRKQRASHQPTRVLAKKLLVEIEARIARGLVGCPEPEPPPQRELTVAELCERYVTEYNRPRIKDIQLYRTEQRSALKRILPMLGGRLAGAVTPGDVRRLRDQLGTRFKPNTVMSTLRPLSTAYSWAKREGIVDCANPCVGVERPARESLLEFLDKDEIQKLLTALERKARASSAFRDWLLYVTVAMTLRTGLRKGEVFGLRWQDLDLTTRRLDIARSYRLKPKSGHVRHLRLPSALAPLFLEWKTMCPKTDEGLVFPVMGRWRLRMGRKIDMLGLPEALAEIGVRPFKRAWHALRHTFASHFVMSGGSILTLQKILGHADIKMTLIYAHLAPDFLGEEMDRIAF